MAPTRASKTGRSTGRAVRPTYELRANAWKLLADQDPRLFYHVPGESLDPEPNLSAIARFAGLSQTTLLKLKNKEQALTLEILACLTNLLVMHGWDRIEAQEALVKPIRFASARRRLVAV
jgi:hypothetical protein